MFPIRALMATVFAVDAAACATTCAAVTSEAVTSAAASNAGLPRCLLGEHRRAAGLVGLVFLVAVSGLTGCSRSADETASAVGHPAVIKTAADPLTDRELELLLSIVRKHPLSKVPEFTAVNDDPPLADTLRSARLVEESRSRIRRLFDPVRQGQQLARDANWAPLLHRAKIDPVEFAALVKRVSCTLTRLRLKDSVDFDQLVEKARLRIEQLTRQIDELDDIPPREMTTQTSYNRTQAVVQLNQTVSLLEFAELLHMVPSASLIAVRAREAELMALVSEDSSASALQDLQQWEERGRRRASVSVPTPQ